MNERDMERLDELEDRLLFYATDGSDPHVEPLDDLARRRVLDRVLARYDEESRSMDGRAHSARKRMWGMLAAGASLLVLAAGAWVVVTSAADEEGAQPKAPAVQEDGTAWGDTLVTSDGTSVLDLPTGIKMAIGPQSRIGLERFDPEEITVRLYRGEIVAELPAGRGGPPFVVESSAGSIRVTGTVLRVEAKGSVVVDVLRGSVVIEDGVHEEKVEGGQRVTLGIAGVTSIPAGIATATLEAARAAGLLEGVDIAKSAQEPSSPLTDESSAVADPDPEPPSIQASYRHVAKGTPPAAAGMEELLTLAGNRRAARDWKGAAAAYAELIERFQTSPQVRTSLLALAEIELVHLGRPSDAIGRFEQYLARWPAGALAPEAEFGRARALGRLGRFSEEVIVLQSFISRHPASPMTPRARSRLESLSAAASGEDTPGQQ